MPKINVYGPGYKRAMMDEHLSAGAKGLLASLAARGEGATFRTVDMPRMFKEGQVTLKKLIDEAERTGYLVRTKKRENDGAFSYSVWKIGVPKMRDVREVG